MSRSSSAPATAGEVFALVRAGAATTRSEIGHHTGLSRTAVAARVSALQDLGLVVETEEGPSTGGRPPLTLTFGAGAGIVLVGAIGRSRTQLAVCDLAGELLRTEDLEQEIGASPGELMPKIVAHLADLRDALGPGAPRTVGIGVSLPGTVDTVRGCSLDSPMMAGWDGVELQPFLAGLGAAPVFVDNDANVMVLAERLGERRKFDDMLLIKASTGLGAGIVSGGVLQRGAVGAAGEIGHTKTAAAQGVLCRCGDVGCVEAIAGGWALVRDLQEQGRDVTHIRDVVALAVGGDAEARRMIRDSGRRIGEVIAGAVNLLDPAVLVVGGDMAEAYDVFVAGLRETLYRDAVSVATRALQILPWSHGDRSGMIGCASMALDQVLSVRAVDRMVAERGR
ncbi:MULTISPECIES: ROK family transcriptional regulator [Rhodococcus]|uniref:ROK family transcriptional regulator n=1 Tax=Rhodococcus TaxID=1827 RepID=UPI000622C50C|nr:MULTISPECIES: ROK family protein [Rhodococcus]AKE92030.1 ROK family transcriptional regulator [Rhodococcus aetherivorans]MBC2589992.1 ROK family protein [Rhodococcus aetherivorans]QIX52755.1 ROK family protein [Rhodococcus sp. DMU1]